MTPVHVSGMSDQVFSYSMKVINSSKKSEYSIKSLAYKQRFSTLNELRTCVKDEIGPIKGSVLGYIEPGHGLKGKMRELCKDDDLSEMYVLCNRKREVLLWCYVDTGVGEQSTVPTRKRPAQPAAPTSTKRVAIAQSISEVEDIIKKLKEKHGDAYSIEKLSCWAHVLHRGSHSSYDEPPDFPFFKKPHKAAKDASACPSTSVANSPTKRFGLRTQCIEQLSKWYALLNAGGIDQSQYEELKDIILGDLKKAS